MLTDTFYIALTSMLASAEPFPGTLFLAVGTGEPRWDEEGLPELPSAPRMVQETARRQIEPANWTFLDRDARSTEEPTSMLQLETTFAANEAVGPLRECGVFAGEATSRSGSGSLLVYFAHSVIQKSNSMRLGRTIVIDLDPHHDLAGSGPSETGFTTQWLGNTSTEELHDLDNERPQCQIASIRRDHRYPFLSVEDAQSLRYDLCAYCFGRELSQS